LFKGVALFEFERGEGLLRHTCKAQTRRVNNLV